MHPLPPVVANDLMRYRTTELRQITRQRQIAHEYPRATHPAPGLKFAVPVAKLRTWAGWNLVQIGLRLAASPR